MKDKARLGKPVSKKEFSAIVQQVRGRRLSAGLSGCKTGWRCSVGSCAGSVSAAACLRHAAAVPTLGQAYLCATPPHLQPSPHQAVRGKPMSRDEVELLYRVFDTNKVRRQLHFS